LAEAWTGGAYPFNDGELEAFPIGWAEMGPAYGEVARHIGVSGVADDDLAPFYPAHDGLMTPIAMDSHSAQFKAEYDAKRARINAKHKFFVGRSRSAALSRDHAGRKACSLSGRCLWGCPTKAFYTPSITLDECRRDPNFEYVSGVCVDHFVFDDLRTNGVGQPLLQSVANSYSHLPLLRCNEKDHAIVVFFSADTPAIRQISCEIGYIAPTQ